MSDALTEGLKMTKDHEDSKKEFMDIFELPTRNLQNVIRFSGKRLIQPESVSDHISDMIALGLYISDIMPGVDKKDLIYRISIHDFDECLYNDIPRKFKYDNLKIKSAIDYTTSRLMKSQFSSELISDIESAKTDQCIEAVLVKALDIVQCTFKLYNEVCLLGNFTLKTTLDDNLGYLSNFINKDLVSKSFINESEKTILTNFLNNILNNVKNDYRKLNRIY
jgi:5'-deoxynucleotidase YfbR-like HD superfamily hydrolase